MGGELDLAAMPRFGFGTYQLDGEECADAVARAVSLGYRHVDTAQSYENEARVRAGIERADADADDVFVASKLSTRNLSYDDVVETTQESVERLGVGSIDLMYVHWPIRSYDPEATLPALDEVVDRGLVDRIGLSNFTPSLLAEAVERLETPVFAHQVECHPMLPQPDLREMAREDGHWLVAYSPIARNQVSEVETIRRVAAKHDATPAQVSLAWLLSKDEAAVIPKARGDHVDENWAARDLTLDDEDLAAIDDLDQRRRVVDFDAAPWNADDAAAD